MVMLRRSSLRKQLLCGCDHSPVTPTTPTPPPRAVHDVDQEVVDILENDNEDEDDDDAFFHVVDRCVLSSLPSGIQSTIGPTVFYDVIPNDYRGSWRPF